MALKSKENSISVLQFLIRRLRIKVSSYTITQELLGHPDYPSLLSMSDALTSWRIPNQALQLDKQNCVIDELPLPFIAHLKSDSDEFILVNDISEEVIFYSNELSSKGKLTRNEFLKHWDGIILYAERDVLSGESNYGQSIIRGGFNQARLPFLIIVTLLASVHTISQNTLDVYYLLLLFSNLLGVVVSTLLLIQSIDANNPLIQNLCRFGKKNDCNAILKSEAAMVTNWLSWSEIGFFYFAGTLICLILVPSSIGLVSWLNVLCLPYTLYSVGYQLKIKNWCVLCCSVQALLWIGATLAFFGGYLFKFQSPLNAPQLFVECLLSFMVPIAIWSFIKPFFVKSGQIQLLKNQFKRFKFNNDLFSQFLTSHKRYELSEEMMPIILGNPNAETVITMVSNPYCGPCATTHKILESWITDRDDLQVKVVFAINNGKEDNATKVARHVIALSSSTNSNLVEHALNDWYGDVEKNYDKWVHKYPIDFEKGPNKATKLHKEWCDDAEISFTPTIFVNGYKLLDPYKLEDLRYFLG